MIITAKADGTLIKTVPDRVYQGSNNADTIIVIAPIIQTAVMNIRFKLPQINEYTENFLMTPANQSIYADLGVSVWAYPITSVLTQYYGTVQAQFSATVNGAIVSSGQFTFDVEKGVEVVLPDPEEPNHTYGDIYNYLENMSTKIFINGELQAKAILPYDDLFSYDKGATIFNADDGWFYTSKNANNKGITVATTSTNIININVNATEFKDLISESGTYTFTYKYLLLVGVWTLNGNEVNLEDYGISFDGIPNNNDTITITYVKFPNTTNWEVTKFYTQSEIDSIVADIELAISHIIDGTTPVAEATHAESATNVAITNNDSGNNANVNFSIGTGSFNKTVNNVANANTAINYAVGGSIDNELKLIKQIALDRENAIVFANNQQIIDWIAGTYQRPDGKTVADLTIGLTIYNQDATQTDYWVSQLPVTSISDLTPFDSDVNPLEADNVTFDASRNQNRLEADNVQDAIDELTDITDEKTNIYELGEFDLDKDNWTLNSNFGWYEYVFTNELLTSATNQTLEFTPVAGSSRFINDANIVIYNDVLIRQGANAVEAVIRAQNAPTFDIAVNVRLKTVAMRINGVASIGANQVGFANAGTDLGSTNVQSAIQEVNTKIGTLSSLDTTVKTDLVSAVNEVNTNANNALPKSDITYFNYNINNIYINSGAYNASKLYGPVTGRLKGIKVGNKIVGVFDITLLPSDMITTGTILVDYIHFGLDLGLSGSWGSSSIMVDSYQSNGIATIDINDTLSTTDVITKVAFPNSTNGWEFSFNKTDAKFYNSRYELRLLLPVEIQLRNLLTGEM